MPAAALDARARSEASYLKVVNFGTSDINNHVIGVYRNVLIELYSYIPAPGDRVVPYTIAQAALPKRYGSLVVKPKGNFLTDRTPKGYNKLSLEWPDFNKRSAAWRVILATWTTLTIKSAQLR